MTQSTIDNQLLTRKGRYLAILRLGTPILVGQLGQIVVGFADTAMVGHYSTDALAAASFVNNIFNIAILMCLGFTYGLTPLIGALYSASRNEDIGATLHRSVCLNFMFSMAITLAMFVVYLNVDKLGQPEHLMPYIRPYFLIYMSTVVAIALFQTFAQTSYAVNSSMIPMWVVLICNLVNVGGNYLLIFGHCGAPELGLVGAGLSTFLSRWLAVAVIVAFFIFARRYRPYRATALRPGAFGHRMGNIFRTSLPVSLQMGLETSSFSIAAVMAGWLGANQLAAFQVFVVIGTLGFCVYYGMAAAVSVLVSNASSCIDAERHMRSIAGTGYVIILVLAATASTVFLLLGTHLIGVFTDDEAVIAMTASMIVPLVIYQLGDATQINFANSLRGTANVMPMVWIAFFSYIVVGVPATYIMAFIFGWGIVGIALSFSVSLFTAGILFLYTFLRTTRSKMPL
ncbi:MAG: MATE family efflux transporter [Muribaculaceae bacterium]|nr:MATE family efflux transporter [Muribaculaceae bacterium]